MNQNVVKPTPSAILLLVLFLLGGSSCAEETPAPVAPTLPAADCTWVPPDPDVAAPNADGEPAQNADSAPAPDGDGVPAPDANGAPRKAPTPTSAAAAPAAPQGTSPPSRRIK